MDDPFIGYQIANYRLEQLLGRGGMGSVYYGWDVQLERPVAVKIIDARYRDDPQYGERFLREARAVAAFRHPNIPPVYYAGNDAGLYYYVMEYIRGMNLAEILRQYRSEGQLMPHHDAIRVARAVASALDYAHARGIIHRDIKPSNVMVASDGRIYLTDFGLALNLSQGTMGEVFGSPRYIAPEQARNSADAVPQSDLYSLGVMLYEILTGSVPFEDPSPTALAFMHINQPPPSPRDFNPDLPLEVEEVLLKALSKDPAARYRSGDELAADLEEALLPPGGTLPLPIGVPLRDDSAPPPTISHLTLADRAAVGLEQAASPRKPEPVPTQPPAAASSKTLSPWVGWGIGCGLLLLLGAIIFGTGVAIALRALDEGNPAFDWSEWTPQVTNLTPIPTRPLAGGELPAETATQAAAPTAASATSASPPTQSQPTEPPTEEPAGETTPASGNRRFAMYYDETSFYFQNLSGEDMAINVFAFERVNRDGVTTNRFDGWIWSEIYPRFRNGYCMINEIYSYTDHLDPPECENRQLVVRTPTIDRHFIFWTPNDNSEEFRVLWNDQEVARCQISAGYCDFTLP